MPASVSLTLSVTVSLSVSAFRSVESIQRSSNCKERKGRRQGPPSGYHLRQGELCGTSRKPLRPLRSSFCVAIFLSVLFFKFFHEGDERLHAATWKGVIN